MITENFKFPGNAEKGHVCKWNMLGVAATIYASPMDKETEQNFIMQLDTEAIFAGVEIVWSSLKWDSGDEDGFKVKVILCPRILKSEIFFIKIKKIQMIFI